MANFELRKLWISDSAKSGRSRIQMFDERDPIVANSFQGLRIFKERRKIEIQDGQVLDVFGILVNEEITILSQDANGVLVGQFSNHLKCTVYRVSFNVLFTVTFKWL